MSGSWAQASSAGKFGADYVVASTDIEIDFGAYVAKTGASVVGSLSGGTWEHHLKRSDGTTWEDGVEGTTLGPVTSTSTSPGCSRSPMALTMILWLCPMKSAARDGDGLADE